MPSSMTHSYFAKDVLTKIKPCYTNIINNEYLKIFAQGPDILYFLNSFNKKNNIIRKLGNTCHKNKTQDFFINLITYIKENNLKQNQEVMSFLFGYLTHYILDSTIHPYIYYKTGIFKKNYPETYKYNGLHQEIEYYLDIYLIFQNEKKEAVNFKTYKYFKYHKLSNTLKKALNITFQKTYEIDNISTYYQKGIQGLITIFKYLRYDKIGIKKIIYKIIDYLSSSNRKKREQISYHVLHNQKIHYLNLDKKEWNHPTNPDETYNYSFIELYLISIDKAINLINEVFDLIYQNKKLNKLNYLIPNISYLTGKDCNDKTKMQYFEF